MSVAEIVAAVITVLLVLVGAALVALQEWSRR
jgi:hypothetical protein